MVDFKGQYLAEQLFQYITITATVIGFFYGWFAQSFERTFECWAVGVVISIIVCVPDWWFYRKNPINWREPDYGDSVSCCRAACVWSLLLVARPRHCEGCCCAVVRCHASSSVIIGVAWRGVAWRVHVRRMMNPTRTQTAKNRKRNSPPRARPKRAKAKEKESLGKRRRSS